MVSCTPVILALQEAEAGESQIQGQTGQLRKILSQNKKNNTRARGLTQSERPGFNLQYCRKKNRKLWYLYRAIFIFQGANTQNF